MLGFAVAISVASAAHADTRAEAESLFREGRRAAEVGNYDTACQKFDASRKLDPAPGTLLNLADCEETRGQLTRAWHDFLALADMLPELDERKGVALERARNLERTMPKLRVRLTASSTPARVIRDDVELGDTTLGVALPVDPGKHVVVVSQDGFRDRTYAVEVSRGEEKDVQVERGVHMGNAIRAAGITLAGVGVASLAASATTGILALTNVAASNAMCTGSVCTTTGAVDSYNRARTFALVSDITLGAGVALVATGIIIYALSHGHGPEVRF
jgi:hypothetical protein